MSLFAALMPVISGVLDLIPNPAQRVEKMNAIISALQSWDAQQNEVNKIEAGHRSLFVAGWRPAIGWTCAIALFYTYILNPFVTWYATAAMIELPPLPSLDENLWELMFGMLGMGGLRTLEKVKGVTK